MRTHHTWDWSSVHELALRETRAILGRGPDAEDAAQEAAMRAWRLRAIARNEALRVSGRRRDEAPLDAAAGLTGDAATADDFRDVRAAVGALDDGDRVLLLLRYWADLTQPEVARATSLPEGTVKVRLHRARQRLRVALA